MARKSHEEAEAGLHDQTQLLPRPQLIFVLCIMAIALMVCFIDQNGIGVLLPTISRDLHAQSSITWAGTSALIANTVSVWKQFLNLSKLLSRCSTGVSSTLRPAQRSLRSKEHLHLRFDAPFSQ